MHMKRSILSMNELQSYSCDFGLLINHCCKSNSVGRWVILVAGIPETTVRDQLVQQINAWNTFLRDAVVLNSVLFDYL